MGALFKSLDDIEGVSSVRLGDIFSARHPTFGAGGSTAFAQPAGGQATLAPTKAFFLMQTAPQSASYGKHLAVIPLYIKLVCTAAGTGGTNLRGLVVADGGARFSSGGTGLSFANYHTTQPAYQSPTLLVDLTRLFAGDITLASEIAPNYCGELLLKNAIPAVGDIFYIMFGIPGMLNITPVTIGGSANVYVQHVAPIALGTGTATGHSLVLHLWEQAQSVGGSFQLEVAWIERSQQSP